MIGPLPNKKSAGPSGCVYEHWQHMEPRVGADVTRLFNRILVEGKMPSQWHRARLTLLFKGSSKDNRDDPNLYGGIASEDTLKKIFCKVLIKRLEVFLDCALPKEQFDFRSGVGVPDAINFFLSATERSVEEHGKGYAFFIDCVKASDRAPRQAMLSAFSEAGVGGQLLHGLESFFEDDELIIQLRNGLVWVHQNNGTPQGNPLSCLAFIVLIRDLVEFVRSESRCFIALHAQDVVLSHHDLNGLKSMLSKVSL